MRHSFSLSVFSEILYGGIWHIAIQDLLFKARHVAVIAIDALVHQVIWKKLLVKHTVSGRVNSIGSRRVPEKGSSAKCHACPNVHSILSSGCKLTMFDEASASVDDHLTSERSEERVVR